MHERHGAVQGLTGRKLSSKIPAVGQKTDDQRMLTMSQKNQKLEGKFSISKYKYAAVNGQLRSTSKVRYPIKCSRDTLPIKATKRDEIIKVTKCRLRLFKMPSHLQMSLASQ